MFGTLLISLLTATSALVLFHVYLKYLNKNIYHLETKKNIDSPSPFSIMRTFGNFIWRTNSIKGNMLKLLDDKSIPWISARYFPGRGNFILVTHPEDIKKVLSSSDFDKSEDANFKGHVNSILGESLIFAGGKGGWDQRKALNTAFTYGKIKLLTPVFNQVTYKFLSVLEKETQPVDIHKIFKNFAFDALGISSFGYDFKSMTGETPQKNNLDLTFSGLINPLDFATHGLWYNLPTPFNKRLKKATSSSKYLLFDVINKRLEQRSQNITQNNDLLDLMLDGFTSDNNLSNNQIVHNMFLFFLAGHETSANTLTASVYYLGKYPEYQEELYNEVMSILGKDGEPTQENVGQFKFINAVLKESLRLNPPILRVGVREAVKDTELRGYFIPKGTSVECNIISAHFSDEFWPNARQFNPHRFIEKDVSSEQKFIFSFSTGPRICIGHKFSTLEMTICLALLSRKYKWSITKEWVDDPWALTTAPKGGLPITLEPRVYN